MALSAKTPGSSLIAPQCQFRRDTRGCGHHHQGSVTQREGLSTDDLCRGRCWEVTQRHPQGRTWQVVCRGQEKAGKHQHPGGPGDLEQPRGLCFHDKHFLVSSERGGDCLPPKWRGRVCCIRQLSSLTITNNQDRSQPREGPRGWAEFTAGTATPHVTPSPRTPTQGHPRSASSDFKNQLHGTKQHRICSIT